MRWVAVLTGMHLALLGCGGIQQDQVPTAEAEEGIYLDQVGTGSPVSRAGFRPGDQLVSWNRNEESGRFSGFDELWVVEFEQATRGPVTLTAHRDGEEITRVLSPGRWRALARPALGAREAELLRRATDQLTAKQPEAALASLVALRDLVDRATEETWVSWRIGLLSEHDPKPHWERSLAAALRTDDPGLEAWVRGQLCWHLNRAGEFEQAEVNCERAIELRRSLGQQLATLEIQYLRARLAGSLGDPQQEEQLFGEVLARLESLAPRSLLVVRALHGVAKARATQDDLQGAFAHGRRALAIAEQEAPSGIDHQASLMILGIFHWFAEEWQLAEDSLREGLEILEAIDPDHEDVSNALNNLGLVAAARGDLAAAEGHYRRSVEVRRRVAPSPLQESRSILNLANLAEIRGDYDTALRYHREVLDLRQRLAPESLDVASPLLNLGNVLVRHGELEQGEHHLKRALGIQRRHVPGSRDVAMTLQVLGELELERNRGSSALAHLTEAHQIAAAVAPGSLTEADILRALGEVRARHGSPDEAVRLLQWSAELVELLAPDTLQAATTHHALGRELRRHGRLPEALDAFRDGVRALDRQFSALGGTDEVRARFRESWRRIYRDLASLLLELGREEEAFEVSERSRAQAFLFLLRARDLSPLVDLEEDLERELREVEASHEQIIVRLQEELAEGDRGELESLVRARRNLQLQRDRLAERAIQLSPRLADLTGSLDLREVQAALGKGTTALSYTVGEDVSWLWVLTGDGAFTVRVLDVGEQALRDLVDRFRFLLETPAPAAQPDALSAQLYRVLISPAEHWVESSDRLVIVPDGPLHHLPFAALKTTGTGQYLIAERPVMIAPSLSAWVTLRGLSTGTEGMVVFADPEIPAAAQAGRPWLPSEMPSLPAARREAERIARRFRPHSRVLLGAQASEEMAKRGGGEARYLHFATHAYVDPLSPLDSALVLASNIGENNETKIEEDGLLEAWEVLQEMNLEAELVTLAGCETGLGAVVADEGILGLTRAFQLAGARSVVASLWRVRDRSSAVLMARLYLHLDSGLPVDEALRRAQLWLLQQPARVPEMRQRQGLARLIRWLPGSHDPRGHDLSHPYHWAGFQLYGAGRTLSQQ